MIRLYLILASALAAGIFATPRLILSQREMAHMLYHDRSFEASREIYKREYAAGNLSPEILEPLIQSSLLSGDSANAIVVLETAYEREPQDRELQRRLEPLYLANFELGAWRQLLEKEAAARQTGENLRKLATAQRLNRAFKAEQETLLKLCQTGEANFDELQRLALLSSRFKRHKDALEAFKRISAQYPEGFNRNLLSWEFRLRQKTSADERELAETLAERAAIYLQQKSHKEETAQLLWQLLKEKDKASAQAVTAIFESLNEQQKMSKEIFAAFCAAQDLLGEQQKVYAFLQERRARAPLPSYMVDSLVLYALESQRSTEDLVGEIERDKLPLGDEKIRQLTFAALERWNLKESAQRIFLALSSKETSPDNADLKNLLYLWGPRPGPEALDWLEEKARKAPPSDRKLWLKHLSNHGGFERAIKMVDDKKWWKDSAIRTLHQELLTTARADRALHAAFSTLRSDQKYSVKDLMVWADQAISLSLWNDAKQILQMALLQEPRDALTLLKLGLICFETGDRRGALKNLENAINMRPDRNSEETAGSGSTLDLIRAHYYFGELLLERGREAEARLHFKEGLRRLEASPQVPADARQLYMHLVSRAKGTKAAISLLEESEKKGEATSEERVLLASMLLDEGDTLQARRLLFDRTDQEKESE